MITGTHTRGATHVPGAKGKRGRRGAGGPRDEAADVDVVVDAVRPICMIQPDCHDECGERHAARRGCKAHSARAVGGRPTGKVENQSSCCRHLPIRTKPYIWESGLVHLGSSDRTCTVGIFRYCFALHLLLARCLVCAVHVPFPSDVPCIRCVDSVPVLRFVPPPSPS